MLKRRRLEAPAERAMPLAIVEPPLERSESAGRFGQILIDEHGVNYQELTRVLAHQGASGVRIGQMLVNEGLIDERTVVTALAKQFKIPVINLRKVPSSPEARAFVSESLARSLNIFPVRYAERDGKMYLNVAVIDPADPKVRTALSELPVFGVVVSLATPTDLAAAINQNYRTLADVSQEVEAFTSAAPKVAEPTAAAASRIQITSDAPVVQVVNKIVTQALRDRASDVHIEPLDDRIRIRYRIDGAMSNVLTLPLSIGPALVSRIKVMADMNIVERRRPQDGQFQMEIDGNELDVRVSTTSTVFGEKAVLRLLDRRRSLVKLSELGMSDDTAARYRKMVASPFGMIIASGPTGSGKTTTLYATLTELDSDEYNVMTIEDPVEYVFPGINQIQINDQADITFAAGLKSILRQDPDVILVGEMRDVETSRIAVSSALTGHLVLSSVHAVDSSSALYRLLDMGIEPFLIASAMVGVVAQRLVRKNCTSCAEEFTPSDDELLTYKQLGGDAGKTSFFKGVGCEFCSGTGFYERVGVYELLTVSDTIRGALIRGATPKELREIAISEGLRTLQDEAIALVTDDVTTIGEVLKTVYVA